MSFSCVMYSASCFARSADAEATSWSWKPRSAATSLPHARRVSGEYEAEQVVRVLREDGVGFGVGELLVPRDGCDPAQIVALIEVESGERLVGGDRHRREELNAVGAAALVRAHDAVVESHGDLGRRHRAQVGRLARCTARRAGERCRGGARVDGTLRSDLVGRAAEALTCDECDERDERDGGDTPRQRGGEAAFVRGALDAGGSTAAVAELGARRERRIARRASCAGERCPAVGAEPPRGFDAAGRTDRRCGRRGRWRALGRGGGLGSHAAKITRPHAPTTRRLRRRASLKLLERQLA